MTERASVICQVFSRLSIEKLEAGVFDGPNIRKLIKNENFTSNMTTLELNAWNSFLGVIQNFLKSHWSHDYLNFIESMLNSYGDIGTNMSIKIHFLHSHLDRFPGNCGAYSDEQGKHFHQDIMVIDRYQGLWNQRMIADDYWNVKRDTDGHNHSRNSRKRKFTLHT